MIDQIITTKTNLSCTLCLSTKHNPIFIKNIRRSLDPYFFKMTDVESYPQFFLCTECQSIFRNPIFILSEELEHQRYFAHNNSLENTNYISYLNDSIEPFLSVINNTDQGLDYGCGPSTGLESLLKNYNIKSFDKYFFNQPELLKPSHYDFIFCHEVVEHFRNFKSDFKQVLGLLKPSGKLLVRTELYPEDQNQFENWYYKNDSTHLFFLSKNSLKYIESDLNLKVTTLDKNKFVFQLRGKA